ncbi:hypothetical protein SBF1_4160004 [Candidatus Desulfosporosinus infrequens]|uniref:Uncharacterized protein n=1 Tax=Candidatus Desulfosporosinus infrequens TaxID=2043169 RepID=A0A2U3L9H3_9FIRM|nr:hypothetical protein SBF1_4160004 [Candidatus Desulfosporosinus infrequens]
MKKNKAIKNEFGMIHDLFGIIPKVPVARMFSSIIQKETVIGRT